jgi:hypothetical protein
LIIVIDGVFRTQRRGVKLKGMNPMKTAEATGIPPELAAEFQEALDDLAKGVRRAEKMQASCERMDRLREENRHLFGEQDITVELVRQARGQT